MKTPEEKERRRRRAALLRNPPRRFKTAEAAAQAGAILAELQLIHNSSRLTGAKKHELFVRGAKQLSELPQ